MKIKLFQEGGQVVEPAQTTGNAQVEEQLAQMAQEIIQQLGPEAAAMLAQIIMDMLQNMQPVNEVPEEQQFMRCGGKITKKAKKACGGKMRK